MFKRCLLRFKTRKKTINFPKSLKFYKLSQNMDTVNITKIKYQIFIGWWTNQFLDQFWEGSIVQKPFKKPTFCYRKINTHENTTCENFAHINHSLLFYFICVQFLNSSYGFISPRYINMYGASFIFRLKCIGRRRPIHTTTATTKTTIRSRNTF